MAVSAGMELMKALANKLKKVYYRTSSYLYFQVYLYYVHPDQYIAHFEAIETLLRDLGCPDWRVFDRTEPIDRTPYLKKEADRLKELEKEAEALG